VTRVILGLTGSIGMGKSTTAKMFADMGVPVWDADATVHRLYEPGGTAGKVLQPLIPEAVLPDGSVDRASLKTVISERPSILSEIEARVHPLVAADRNAFLSEQKHAPIVLLDIPLLFETNGTGLVDKIVVASTSSEEQRRRVLARPSMDEATFERLLARQVPDEEKRAQANYIVRTDDLETARRDVRHILEEIRIEQTNA